jgi:uncharacterized protein (TIGR02246 family)
MMAANSPLDVLRSFEKALEAGDIAALAALYEPGAVLPGEPGQPVAVGPTEIAAALQSLVDLRPADLKLDGRVVADLGDVVVVYDDWRGTGHTPDGNEVPLSGKAIEVLRRQEDGTWRYIFDDPMARG